MYPGVASTLHLEYLCDKVQVRLEKHDGIQYTFVLYQVLITDKILINPHNNYDINHHL